MGEELILPEETVSDLSEMESIIVVSDLHLGGNDDLDTMNRLCTFLDKIASIQTAIPADDLPYIEILNGRKYLRKPKKIILLGDILELWNPRNQNRDNVFCDAAVPFAKLQELDCDVVYVTGNHDENVGDIIDCNKNSASAGTIDFVTQKNKKFSIFKRSYIPNGNKGLNVGGIYYAFLHGHQFDQQQITYTISKCIGSRFDPVGYIADIANNYVAKSIPFWVFWSILLMWGMLIGVYWLLPNSILMSFLTVIIWGAAVVILLYNYQVFGSKCKKNLEPALVPSAEKMAWVTLILAIIIAIFLILGIWLPVIYSILFTILLAVYTYFFAVIAVPKFVAFLQRDAWDWYTRAKKAKDKTPEEVIKGNFEGKKFGHSFFDPKKYTLKANVVVFGHTHCSGRPVHVKASDSIAQGYEDLQGVFFYNTGCWVKDLSKMPRNDDSCRDRDTFVYIDTDGIYLLKWDCGEIKYIHHNTAFQIAPLARSGSPQPTPPASDTA